MELYFILDCEYDMQFQYFYQIYVYWKNYFVMFILNLCYVKIKKFFKKYVICLFRVSDLSKVLRIDYVLRYFLVVLLKERVV